MTTKRVFIFLMLLPLWDATSAQIKVISHLNFGKTGNISYVSAPSEVYSSDSKIKLKSVGDPVFNAEAPMGKALKGDGCILFHGNGDGYTGTQPIGKAGDNMILEVWVKARTHTHGKTHKRDIDRIRPVVTNGVMGDGYSIAQKGKKWVLAGGKSGNVDIGNVILNQWVHLAAVRDGDSGTVWRDGKQTNTFTPATSYGPGFSIAASLTGKYPSYFNGDIYEIRYSTFKKGAFDPNSDFLLYYEKKKEKNEARLAERARLVQVLESDGLGKELVTTLPTDLCTKDWLITPIETPCKLLVQKSKDGITSTFQLNNGLVSRTFYMSDNVACVGYRNLSNDAEYIRAVKPEARIMIDSVWYEIGGLKGQPENSYLLKKWYPELENSQQAFQLSDVQTSEPIERYKWRPQYNAVKTDWPPKGLHVTMTYKRDKEMSVLKDFEVKIHYEIYQGIPVIAKWFEVISSSDKKVVINGFESEVLAINQDQIKRLHVESDFSFADINKDVRSSSFMNYAGKLSVDAPYSEYTMPSSTTLWTIDPDYNTWATQNPAEDKYLDYPHHNMLLSRLPAGPGVYITKDAPFKSYITFELLQDSEDKERWSLGFRRMYKQLAPQVTESLLSANLSSGDPEKIKGFMDQMVELKMERMETNGQGAVAHNILNEEYVAKWKDIATYAKERNIVFGAYELQITSKRRGADVDCVPPPLEVEGKRFGRSVCIASKWKDTYFDNMWKFYDRTGFTAYNVDGPFHGRICASTEHKYHRGLEDSQWEQWKTQIEVIHEFCRRGMRIQIPDWYYLNGNGANGMGFREAAANLPPQQHLLLARQYIYDGTWFKLPTMGYINLHLNGPYAKDPKVGILPLKDHLDRYRQALMTFLGSGCQFGISTDELYDAPETKEMVMECLDWFRKYRDILTSEIIHVSRPNGRDIDCMLHVNPTLKNKGMVVVFNPTDADVEKSIKIPLYYTGLKGKATIKHEGGNPTSFTLNNKEELSLPVKIKAQGTTWFLIE